MCSVTKRLEEDNRKKEGPSLLQFPNTGLKEVSREVYKVNEF